MVGAGWGLCKGEEVCSEPNVGSRFSVAGVQACKYQGVSVCRQILAANKRVKQKSDLFPPPTPARV